MGLSQNGLHSSGETTNFSVWYEDTLPNQTGVKAAANALISVLETEFSVTTGWFGTPNNKFGSGNKQKIYLDKGAGGGGSNNGYANPTLPIHMDSIGGGPSPLESIKMVWMNEWVEVLMSIAGNWNSGDSSGEGLSQYCGIVRFPVGHYSYYPSWVDGWLNGTGQAFSSNNGKLIPSPNSKRSDWVNQTFTGKNISGNQVNGDGDQISYGCALAFIYYLTVQLDFSINEVIKNYSNNLASAYSALTGDSGNPFPYFLKLFSKFYPASSTAAIPGPVSDNPFPLAQQMQVECILKYGAVGSGMYDTDPMLQVGGRNHTFTENFRITQKQCIALINGGSIVNPGEYNAGKNYRFYVVGGGKTADVGVFQHNVPGPDNFQLTSYIATNPDDTKADNLLSLPECT